jgi:anti-repressor protein
MTNELQVFSYEENEIRTVEVNGEPWWVLKDVCAALGIVKYRDVAERLDGDERAPVRVDTLGGNQEMICVNESGLYSVILRSDKPEARKFKRWITHEVLPEIRRTGGYALDFDAGATLASATNYIKTLMRQMEKQGRTAREIAEMIVLVAKRYSLPIPRDFAREPAFEQIRLTYNVAKAAEASQAAY